MRTTVDIVLDHGMIARLEKRHHDARYRRHTGAEKYSILAPFEISQFFNNRPLVRDIEIAGIEPYLCPDVLTGR
jgi:hypothetical protein